MNENKKFSISNMMLAFITVLVVIGLVALTGFFLLTPPDDIIMGQAEANQVRSSGKTATGGSRSKSCRSTECQSS